MRAFSFLSGGIPLRALSARSVLATPSALAGLFVLSVLGFLPAAAAAQYPGELRGRVVDGVSGQGVAGVRVTLTAEGRGILTDGDGRLHLRGVPPGEAVLHAARFGYRDARISLDVRNGEITRFELRLTPLAIPAPALRVEAERSGRTILDRADIRASGARTLGEVLAGAPGVVVVRRGVGGSEELRLRGGGSDHVLVLVDGVALNDPVTGTADLSGVSALDLARIEVIPGAQAARFGPGAMTGVVLVETRSGGADTGAEPPARVAEVGARGGSLGERALDLGVSDPRLPLGMSLGASYRRLHGEFDFVKSESLGGGRARRRNADVEQRSFRLSAAGTVAAGRWTAHLRGEDLARGVPGKSFAPSLFARQRQEGVNGTASWRREGEAHSVTARLSRRIRTVHFSDPAPPLGLPFDNRTRGNETSGSLHAELRRSASLDLLLGAGLDVDRRSLEGEHLALPATPTDGSAVIHAEVGGGALPAGLLLSGAFRAHRDGYAEDWLAAHDLTLRLGWRGMRAHLSHRSSFSPPSAGDLFFREGVGIRPNPDLRAERVRGEWEAGASTRFAAGSATVHLDGELFGGDMEDMIVWAPDFRFVWSPRNVDVRRRGGELRGELRHPRSGLRGGGHFSRVRATYLSGGGAPGVQVIYRPRHSAGLHLEWSRGGARIGTRGIYTGSRYPVPAAVNALEAFWTVDLSAGLEWELDRWILEPSLRVDRLLDGRDPFIHAFPEPGRTFLLELRVRPAR